MSSSEADVVLLRSGEVEERRAERPRRDHSQVDLQTASDDERALRVATREDALDARRADEHVEDGRGVVAGHDDVDIADRLLVSPDAARELDTLDAGLRAQIRDHRR